MADPSPIELLIAPRRRRIGDGEIDRLLPFRSRRMIGPFIYADLIGPDLLPEGVGVDVPVHPHIGLATLTYLFGGALVHRDSTGAVQRIEPGGVNWMTAGRAVAHSERSPDDERAASTTIAGLQTWVALPEHAEQIDPSFVHVPARELPQWVTGGVQVRLVAGGVDGRESPVPVHSSICYLDVRFVDAGDWRAPTGIGDRGVIVVHGEVRIDEVSVPERHLAVLAGGAPGAIVSSGPARVIVIGGAAVGPRRISWNFVSSDRDRIEWARTAWAAGDWPMVAGDDEIVPLP